MTRTAGLAAALITVTGLSAAAMYLRSVDATPTFTTDTVSRGSIVSQVSATGTLEAVETVLVGTQVSGSVKTLYADYNSIVRKGQLLAQLDPALTLVEIERVKATLAGAEADLDRLKVMEQDARTKRDRARALSDRQLIAKTELDAAETALLTSEAQVKSAAAQVTQARASLSQAQVNLAKTSIASPIDGIVISRDVDVGQTVAASLQAPTIFTIAADLRRMQLKASIDESDLGNVHKGQAVTFQVDAYPNEVFRGVVEQVRLNPVIEQNVVTYAAIISAPNPELKLKPGMTATLSVEVLRRDGVLRVPAAALRFRPSAAVLAALGEGAPASTRGSSTPATAATSGSLDKKRSAVWIYLDGHLQAVPVQIGASDATFAEITGGDLQEGAHVVTQATLPGAATARSASPTSNPLMGQMPRR